MNGICFDDTGYECIYIGEKDKDVCNASRGIYRMCKRIKAKYNFYPYLRRMRFG